MTKWKNLLWICALLVTCNFVNAKAGITENLHGADLEEIEEMGDQILQFVNGGYAGLYEGEPAEESDLDFENAYLVYTDANTLLDGNRTVADFEAALKELPVVWCIPVSYEETTCIVEVSRGLPLRDENSDILTDEQKAEIRNNEGKWTVTSAVYDEVNQQQEAEALLGDAADDVVLVGGVFGVSGLVGLVIDDQEVEGLMLLDCSLTLEQGASDGLAKNSDDGILLEKGKLYSVREFADAVAKTETHAQPVSADQTNGDAYVGADGAYGVNRFGVAGLALLAVLLVVGIRRFNLKS